MKKIVLKLIKIYQKTLSPDHGLFAYRFPFGYCKFHPTCSEYSHQAIRHFGLVKGGGKALTRILRCHPFSRGGYDPVLKND